MIFRRATWFIYFLLLVGSILWLPTTAVAEAPGFRISLQVPPNRLSPFPGIDGKFIASITPESFYPLSRTAPPKEYEYSYNPDDSLLTYVRFIRPDMKLIPVSSDVDAFVNRRMEINRKGLTSEAKRASLVKEQQHKAGGLLSITIPIRSRTFESIFGEGGAGLKVSGYRKITFSGRSNWTDGQQSLYNRQSKFPSLNMEQVYRFDITGTIGSKISVAVAQDSRNDLPLANRLILRYRGSEDDVLQSVEAGNTQLDLPSTQFLRYSTRVQGLFGIKATAKIADLSLTAIASQEKGSTETVEISGGTSTTATRVIREIDYRKRTVFDLGRLPLYRAASDPIPENGPYDFLPAHNGIEGDSIVYISVYVDEMPTDPADRAQYPPGICYVDPTDTLGGDPTSEYTANGNFKSLDINSYYCNRKGYYVIIYNQIIGPDDILGVYMRVWRGATGTIDTIGNIDSDTLRLKLIKPKYHTSTNHHVWEYEWRNVYYLGSENIDTRELEVNIYRGAPLSVNGQQPNPEAPEIQSDTLGRSLKFLQILGLDQTDASNNPGSDGRIDTRVIDAASGLLYFPDRHPFDSDIGRTTSTDGDTIRLAERVPELYTATNETAVNSASKYYLTVTNKERGNSMIDLRSSNIIEGSEVITLNGEVKKKGTDYEIDYDMGRLTLLTDQMTDINADLSVMFETAPLFSLSRKTLLGTRLEYAPGTNFKLGATLLYKSDKATNRKPKVGEETSKITVMDMDFSYSFQAPLFTKLIDALPFISTKALSSMRISGEVAQSRPNPNVDGQVYIDDFEGSDESYSLGIRRNEWRPCSRPKVLSGQDTTLWGRGQIAWDTRDNYSDSAIWNRETAQGTTDNTTVMVVNFQPVTEKVMPNATGDSLISVPIEPERSWNGFMKNIPAGVVSQLENAQLIEMRVRGDVGIMHIDLGMLSGDVNGNGRLDTEDKNGNGVLDVNDEDNEDVGLDTLPDAREFGYGPGNLDPAGDNFDPNNTWRINGTEGNVNDIGFGGNIPNTEDPGGKLVKDERYFSFRVDLSDDSTGFYVPGTRNTDKWKTIRIPLRDMTALDTIIKDNSGLSSSAPSWSEIKYARVWFDSASAENLNKPQLVEIASFDMVSNVWADSLWVADSLRGGPTSFDVAVINDEIDTRYVPPPGVAGYFDPTKNVTEKEQSLLLRYDNLKGRVMIPVTDSGLVFAADTGLAVRKLFRATNYMGYGKLEAYVHGPAKKVGDSLMFFMRIGTDKSAYYEFYTYLDTGWSSRNHVVIDFTTMTGLKAELLNSWSGTYRPLTVTDSVNHYRVRVTTGGQDPTLTRVQYFAMGVVNCNPSQPVSGEVWIDELRLTDVRDDVGMAGQIGIGGSFVDFIDYNVNYRTQDAYYRGVSNSTKGGAAQNLGSGRTESSHSASATVKLHRLFPRSMGLQLPVTVSWTQNVNVPLLRTNTDITIPPELKKAETSFSSTKGFQIREKIQKNTNNIIYTALLNRFSTNFSYNLSQGHSATQPMYMRESVTASAIYNLGMKKVPSISPLSWMKPLKPPFGLAKTKIYLYPNQLDLNGSFSGEYAISRNKDGANPSSIRRDFTGTMTVAYKLFDNLGGNYSMSTTRDLKDPRTVHLTINPKALRLGKELRYSQNARASYSPTLFKFLTHSVEYTARYSDDVGLNNADSSVVHRIGLGTSTNFSFSLKHQSLFGTNKKGGGAKRSKQGDKTAAEHTSLIGLPLKGLRYITDAVKPVSMRYSITENNSASLTGKATQAYRLGLTKDPGVPSSQNAGNSRQARTLGRSLSANSGVSLFSGISMEMRFERSIQETQQNGTLERVSQTWPDVTFNLRSIRGLWYLGKLLNAISPSSGYNHGTEYSKYADSPFRKDEKEHSAFAPLLGFSINVTRTLRTTGRFESSSSQSTNFSETSGNIITINRSVARGISGDVSYSFRSPSGIKLPILGRIKFESTLTLSVNVSYRMTKEETGKAQTNFELEPSSERTSLNVQPSASYSFSSTVKGGLTGRWQDNNDSSQHRRTHTRELSFWVEMNF